MPLKVAAGQYSAAGRKPANQDFHGLAVPREPLLATKGVAIALADGISSSASGRQASAAAVHGFLADYYCTSETWSVKKSVERVLAAINSWLFAQTQQGQGRYDKDRGWVCTFSAIVVKGRTAHLFHVGDARIWQVQGQALEPLTTEHRVHVGGGQSHLGRALGVAPHLEIDYRSVPLAPGDTFVLATDGVHEHVPHGAILAALTTHDNDLDAAARAIADQALHRGSEDNLTVQVLRIEALPQPEAGELHDAAAALPLPPLLAPRMEFDGWTIVRELHASSRSHIHLAVDLATQQIAVLKTPSIALADDPAYRERFLLEEWVARRIDSPHVVRAVATGRPRRALYLALEYIEGRTLRQWMVDHPRPPLDAVRAIVGQVARGLRALHRMEMVHQDLRPENVMIDATGTVRIIDLGATSVAGIVETTGRGDHLLGTPQYSAPECFLGGGGTPAADQFALAVIGYEMLTGQLPHGAQLAQCRTLAQQKRVRYRTLLAVRPELPLWIDEALRKAVQPEPQRRHGDVDEFVASLHRPDSAQPVRRRPPLAARDPVAFWQGVSLLLAIGWLAMWGLRSVGA
ncbi:bifunctional protein-serine/threonine kinase/phosphatase [Ramlibacter sp.]|uniref:bifunctional protein-serine/threonine kinase/phosphatase n=1 Tax=Ramlibacter sp. TaxID=1917967 RepID=UPI002612C6AF|nr:bifunctional protein-serine/threonine kinase/phosphatase [Ramlibacter sp.]MDB5956870.1 bifunctional protein-serine/threonine kinase/phosphatase [Ramlibacter sp.]